MRLRSKLDIGFGFILFLMTLCVLLSILMMRSQIKSIDELVVVHFEKVSLIDRIEEDYAGTARKIRDLLLDPANIDFQEINNIEDTLLKTEQIIEKLQHEEDDQRRKEFLTELMGSATAYRLDVLEVSKLLKAGEREEAARLFLTPEQNMVRLSIEDKGFAFHNLEYSKMKDLLMESNQTYQMTILLMLTFLALALILGIGISRWSAKGVSHSIRNLSEEITRVRKSNGQIQRIEKIPLNELEPIAQAYNRLVDSIEQHAQQEEDYKQTLQEKALLETKVNEIIVLLQGITDLSTVANLFMNKISLIINAQMGVIYLRKWECNNGCVINAGQSLIPLASYACDINLLKEKSIQLGKGIIGQCAQDHQTVILNDIPKDYLKISSGLGEAPPQAILVLPIEFEGEVIAVLEFASLHTFTLFEQKLLERIAGILGIALYSIAQQMQMKKLLEQSQSLTEELQIQSKELQLQHGELRSALEQLEKQYQESELKTQEIAKVSQFKSEFLANMSHELRTPLNSILILAQTLAENKKGGLTPKQVEYATTIYSAGKDLLDLINDILDLSKVESGKMNIILSKVNLEDLQKELEGQFMPVADQKGLSFEIQISPELPKIITMDKAHVLQILKNLLANAFKFTERGSVQLEFYQPGKDTLDEEGLNEIPFLAVTVSDTGPGIPEEQQTLIFEAFRQVDGTISRKYGGTGLGLSISRQLAHLIGGTIKLKSKVGKGSIFTLYIPMVLSDIRKTEPALHDEITDPSQIPTEESKLIFVNPKPLEGKTILIVDDDISNVFALTSLLEAYKMNALFAENGREALEMLADHSEIDLVLMDIMMPEMDGYETMSAIRQIDKLKMLPIIAVTAKAMKNDREKCIEAGASDYIQKPINTDQLLSVMQVWL